MADISYSEFCRKFNIKAPPISSGERALHIVWCFSLPLSPAELWPYIADTSSFNRYLGMAPRQEKEVEGKRHVKTTMLGFAQEWVEEPWSWFHEVSIHSHRAYSQGIAKAVTSHFFLEPSASGVDFYVNFSWTLQNNFSFYFLKATESLLKNKFKAAFATVIKFVSSHKNVKPRALSLINEPAKNVNLAALEKAAENLKMRSLNPVAVDGLCQLIKTGDDFDLYRIKAIVLAQNLNVSKKDLLKVCMEGVRYGLLSISWDVICPHCRGVRLAAQNMGQIPANTDCMVCEVDFQTDTLESIEVVFHVHPSYRKVTEVLFCAAEPSKKDHIQVQQKIEPFQTLHFHQNLQEGRHRLRVTNPTANYYFEVQKESPKAEVTWDLAADMEKAVCGPSLTFTIQNKTNQIRDFHVEQLWWKDDILHPVDIFTMPEYRDVFSRESLESHLRISMGVQVVMFTDIVNSTSFYNKMGDAAAFSEVKKHFTDTFAAVEKCEGAVIKTIGDSIMACFSDPEKALQAAVEIQDVFHSQRADTSIRLRVSLHFGQVIAVHLLQGLDLFGTTVNKAAKLQACANAGEVACSDEFFKALDASTQEKYANLTTRRKSHLIYKEMPLEALVIKCHGLDKLVDKSA